MPLRLSDTDRSTYVKRVYSVTELASIAHERDVAPQRRAVHRSMGNVPHAVRNEVIAAAEARGII